MTINETRETTNSADHITKQPLDLHQKVTDTIIGQLEKGTVPWHKPWKNDGTSRFSIPKNFITGKQYRGINVLLLWSTLAENNYPTNDWASFRQWQDKKEFIRKGEKGTLIVFTDKFEKEVDGEIKRIPYLKYSLVFNRAQLATYKHLEPAHPKETHEVLEEWNQLDNFIRLTGAEIIHGGNDAAYHPNSDIIYLPDINSFLETENSTATEAYFGVACHELTHWTGNEKRLNRPLVTQFGTEKYAQEELVAELGSSFICAEYDITTGNENNAAYIANWLKVLKNNKHFIFHAAREATKAVDYLKSLQPE